MNNKRLKRDMMLVLTTIGTFLSMLAGAFAIVLLLAAGPDVLKDVMSGNWRSLQSGGARLVLPTIVCSTTFIATWFCYRQYKKLLDE